MKSGAQTRFDRNVDPLGRLSLPKHVLNEYDECIIALGHHGHYLQLMDDGTWAVYEVAFDNSDFKDIEMFRLQRRMSHRFRLRMDPQHRITIPLPLLELAGIKPGSAVVGIKIMIRGGSYWSIYSREEYIRTEQNVS